MDYSHFLFAQLFYAIFPQATIEYDLVYPHIIALYDEYEISAYNMDTKSEYDCITDFLSSKIVQVVNDKLLIK